MKNIEDWIKNIEKEMKEIHSIDIVKIIEDTLAKELLDAMFDEFDKESSLPINADDVFWMPEDEYNDGYWYNRVTGKILTDEQIKKLNL